RPGKVHHSEVRVLSLDWMDIHEDRRWEHLHVRQLREGFLHEYLDFKTAFLECLAMAPGDGILAGVNMPANRQPFLQATMVNEENTVFLDDEDRNGEVEVEIEMRHHEKRPAKSGPRKGL